MAAPPTDRDSMSVDMHTTTGPDDWKLRAGHDERFYANGTPRIPDLALEVLTQYSKIPEADVVEHVMTMRDRAYNIHPYPCIGRFRFLTFSLAGHPLYESHVLPTLLQASPPAPPQDPTPSTLASPPLPAPAPSPSEPVFLDVGTCLGQDLRLLLHRGVPVRRIFATDIEPAFFDLGYEFFRDADTLPAAHQLAPIDLFADALFAAAPAAHPPFAPAAALAPFAARVDALHISAVFHLFSYNDQVTVARRVLGLMRPPAARGAAQAPPRAPAVLFGCQTAHALGKEYPQRVNGRGEMLYRHNPETWERMWLTDVAPGGLVTYPGGEKAKLRFKTDMGSPEGNLPGLVGAENDKGGARDDLFFKWMSFEIWIDPVE